MKKSLRSGFGEALAQLGKNEPWLVALSADLAGSLYMTDFKNQFPERFFQIGVAEQNLVSAAAGLALAGLIPVAGSFATFLGRAWEQVRVDVCLNQLPVLLVGSHAGLSHPADGVTAQATEDIAIFRSLPNLQVLVPADFNQVKLAFKAWITKPQPTYLRLYREPTEEIDMFKDEFVIGQAQIIKPGSNLTIISAGPIINQVIPASQKLEVMGISCELIDLGTIQPIDQQTLIKSARKTGRVVTVEDHQLKGGVGSAVAEVLSQHVPLPIKMIGLTEFTKTARSYTKLLEAFKLDSEGIYQQIKDWLEYEV
jgi:transketolase